MGIESLLNELFRLFSKKFKLRAITGFGSFVDAEESQHEPPIKQIAGFKQTQFNGMLEAAKSINPLNPRF